MFILKVFYKSGQLFQFGYRDATMAKDVRDGIEACKAGQAVQVMDDHGHEAVLIKADMVAIQVTDVAAEVAGEIEVAQLVERLRGMNRPAHTSYGQYGDGALHALAADVATRRHSDVPLGELVKQKMAPFSA
jgi:hypothetical protein